MNLRKPGILGYFDTMSGMEGVAFARAVEKLGYSVLWVPETFGRDPFVMATHLLNATEGIVVGTAIANVWKREAMATGAAARTLAELFDDRFILGRSWKSPSRCGNASPISSQKFSQPSSAASGTITACKIDDPQVASRNEADQSKRSLLARQIMRKDDSCQISGVRAARGRTRNMEIPFCPPGKPYPG
jgi:Luciferase-like monooxygenase